MYSFEEIIEQVKQTDIRLFDEKLKLEKEKQRILQMKSSQRNTYNINELMNKISGNIDEDGVVSLGTKEENHERKILEGFPPPPTGPIGKT